MRTAMTAIALRPREIVTQARTALAESGCATQGARVLVVGVTYKPDVADVRESPALEIIDQLLEAGAQVSFTDPHVPALDTRHGRLYGIPRAELSQWDLVIVHTRHADVDLDWLRHKPLVLDTTYQKDRP